MTTNNDNPAFAPVRKKRVHGGYSLVRTLIWIAIVAAICGAIPVVIENYADTDNVRELFRTDNKHFLPPHTWFTLLCLSVPLSARTVLRLVQRKHWKSGILLALLSPLAGWYCLRFSVTVESIHDILGSIKLGWPYDLEYIARFSVVYISLWIITLLGILPNPLKKNLRSGKARNEEVEATPGREEGDHKEAKRRHDA